MFGTSTPYSSSSSSEAGRRSEKISPGWKGSFEDDSGVDLSLQEGSFIAPSSSSISSPPSFSSDSGIVVDAPERSSVVAPRRGSSWRSRLPWWVGKERLDILRVLCDMNASHLLQIIGSYVGGKELIAMCLVSKTWNAIVDSHFNHLKMEYLLSIKSDFENSGYEEVRRIRTTPRKAMANVSNFVSLSLLSGNNSSHSSSFNSSSRVPSIQPTSPSKIRHKLFTEEASKLSPGECLQSCPRCTNPSRVIPSEFRATCSRISCAFQFCTKCMCSAHVGDASNSVCRTPTKSAGKVSNKSIVSMRKSRRRLKRL